MHCYKLHGFAFVLEKDHKSCSNCPAITVLCYATWCPTGYSYSCLPYFGYSSRELEERLQVVANERKMSLKARPMDLEGPPHSYDGRGQRKDENYGSGMTTLKDRVEAMNWPSVPKKYFKLPEYFKGIAEESHKEMRPVKVEEKPMKKRGVEAEVEAPRSALWRSVGGTVSDACAGPSRDADGMTPRKPFQAVALNNKSGVSVNTPVGGLPSANHRDKIKMEFRTKVGLRSRSPSESEPAEPQPPKLPMKKVETQSWVNGVSPQMSSSSSRTPAPEYVGQVQTVQPMKRDQEVQTCKELCEVSVNTDAVDGFFMETRGSIKREPLECQFQPIVPEVTAVAEPMTLKVENDVAEPQLVHEEPHVSERDIVEEESEDNDEVFAVNVLDQREPSHLWYSQFGYYPCGFQTMKACQILNSLKIADVQAPLNGFLSAMEQDDEIMRQELYRLAYDIKHPMKIIKFFIWSGVLTEDDVLAAKKFASTMLQSLTLLVALFKKPLSAQEFSSVINIFRCNGNAAVADKLM